MKKQFLYRTVKYYPWANVVDDKQKQTYSITLFYDWYVLMMWSLWERYCFYEYYKYEQKISEIYLICRDISYNFFYVFVFFFWWKSHICCESYCMLFTYMYISFSIDLNFVIFWLLKNTFGIKFYPDLYILNLEVLEYINLNF